MVLRVKGKKYLPSKQHEVYPAGPGRF